MTPAQIAALDALIQAVEAGDESWVHLPRIPELHSDLVWKAWSGSLDAARALHDALLPGWDVTCLDQASNLAGSPWGCEVASFDGSNPDNNQRAYSGHNFDRNPSRSWLLAILRAIKSQVNHD